MTTAFIALVWGRVQGIYNYDRDKLGDLIGYRDF